MLDSIPWKNYCYVVARSKQCLRLQVSITLKVTRKKLSTSLGGSTFDHSSDDNSVALVSNGRALDAKSTKVKSLTQHSNQKLIRETSLKLHYRPVFANM